MSADPPDDGRVAGGPAGPMGAEDERAPSGFLRPAPGRFGEGGPTTRAAALERVRHRLLEAGASEREIDRAVEDNVLDLLAVDRLLVPAPRRYSQIELAARTDLPLGVLKRLWRALGFLDVPEDERAFTDLDLEAARLFGAMLELGAADVETAVQLARVIGSSMARIAEAEVAPGPLSNSSGADADSVEAADDFVAVADSTLPAMARLLEFVWRRHVQVATRRIMLLRAHGSVPGASPLLAVGFADMVGFTLLSQHLNEEELASVVARFEELSHDIVTGLGGRVVKMIGDEVMFVVDSVVAAVRIALGLAEAYADDDLLSDVRVGLGFGPVLLRDGDYFGPTVNLAHRIVNIGNPGTVLMADEFHRQLLAVAPGEFAAAPLRPRTLKDLGRVQLWWVGRAGDEVDGTGAGADRRRNVRWDRLAEVLRELDGVRTLGESALAARRPAAGRGSSGAGEPDGGDPERA